MSKTKFPKSEAEIMKLAQNMISGFTDNPTVFPAPPFTPTQQQTRLTAVKTKINDVVQKTAEKEQAVDDKDAEMLAMTEEMKECIGYAEYVTKGDDAKLKLIGWSGRAEPQKQLPPGQPRGFEIVEQGAGWVHFDWKDAKGAEAGGAVQMYKLLARPLKSAGDMKEIGASVVSEITLTDQPRGVETEYAVVAVNKAGQSQPSNSITLTL